MRWGAVEEYSSSLLNFTLPSPVARKQNVSLIISKLRFLYSASIGPEQTSPAAKSVRHRGPPRCRIDFRLSVVIAGGAAGWLDLTAPFKPQIMTDAVQNN